MIIHANKNTGLTQSPDVKSFWADQTEKLELLQKIMKGEVECTFCKENATGLSMAGLPVCDIPGNHPEEDSAVV